MKKFSTKLLAMILMLTVVLSAVSIGGADQVYAISISDDMRKLFEVADHLTNTQRAEIVNLIADDNYLLLAGYESNASEIFGKVPAAVASEHGVTSDTIENGLAEFGTYYNLNATNRAFAKYALRSLEEGITDYSTVGYSFTTLKSNIESYTITFNMFMNFMNSVKSVAGFKPLTTTTAKTSLQKDSRVDTLINLAATFGSIDDQIVDSYINRLEELLASVNNYNITERTSFIQYLIDKDMVTVISSNSGDNDNDSSGGSGGGAPTTPVTPAVTPAPTQVASTITTAPTLNTSTGTATASITQATITSALSSAAPVTEGVKEATIEVPAVTGAKSYAVELPSNVLNTTTVNHTIEIVTEIASVELPSNMITGTAADNKVELTVAKAETAQLPEALKAQIGSKPVIELNLKVGGKQVNWNNPSAPVTVSVAYTPTADELKYPENIVVWYIDGSNNVVSVPSGKYDLATGKVTFNVEHFSKYAVAFSIKTFNDLDKYGWAKKQIGVMASKGIVTGISADKFNPGDKVTRGDYLKSLINALGLSAKFESSFSDVKVTDAYYKEIAVAKELGITTGIGSNKYAPEKEITRQDMMVLTAKALSVAKKMDLTDSTMELNNFGDQAKIAAYARNSAAAMIRTGLIVGDGKNVNPYANTSRAEAAVIMYRIYNK